MPSDVLSSRLLGHEKYLEKNSGSYLIISPIIPLKIYIFRVALNFFSPTPQKKQQQPKNVHIKTKK